jgi:hypothetical protein
LKKVRGKSHWRQGLAAGAGFKDMGDEETGLKVLRGLEENDKQSIKAARAEAWESKLRGQNPESPSVLSELYIRSWHLVESILYGVSVHHRGGVSVPIEIVRLALYARSEDVKTVIYVCCL